MQRFLSILRSNWITATGAVVTTLSFMAFVTTLVYLTLHGGAHGAYLGIFAFLLLPMGFVAGIVLVPLGLIVYRKQFQARMARVQERPIRVLSVIGVLTAVNFATVGTAGYEAAHYMDSPQFCGTFCHTQMYPTYVTALDAPHANVACVECHIGPGVGAMVKAKLNGLRQVAGVLFDNHARPIPTPVHTVRPAREICESCHWPGKTRTDRLVVRPHFGDDPAVTPATNVLMMKVGGPRPDGSIAGIHWHADAGTDIQYISGDGRRTIGWIRYVDKDGNERIYTTDGENLDTRPEGEVRRMDCIDCHNQPGHYQQEPSSALDEAIADGRVSRELPSIRKHALATLQKEWDRDTARPAILADLRQAYDADGGLGGEKQPLLEAAAGAVADIWLRNVHPAMKVTWGTYPNFIGHDGCMRCHDGMHEDKDGNVISFDCAQCHTVLAEKSDDPDILKKLGLTER